LQVGDRDRDDRLVDERHRDREHHCGQDQVLARAHDGRASAHPHIPTTTGPSAGVGLYHLLQGGSCSTTGYGRYGPLPKCPAGTGWWVAFLTAGIFIGSGGALRAGSAVFVVPGLFTAIGLAPILFALDNTDERGAVLAALGLATVVSSSVHDQQVAAKRKAAKLVRSANHVGSGTQARREGGVGTEPPRPRDAAAVGPSSPRSLFRAQNLTVALAALWGALGANADLSAFDLYPSEADAIVADAGTRRIVRVDVDGDVRVDVDGDVRQGRREEFSGSLQVIYLWQIRPGVPQSLARQIARRGRVPTRRLDRMVVDTT
jgi:hypothetical protein